MRASRLSGLNTLSYVGVEPISPPDLRVQPRDPTVNDWKNFDVGCLWITDNSSIIPAIPQQVWMLVKLGVDVTGVRMATWVPLYPNGGGGGAITFVTDNGNAASNLGILNVLGGTNLGVAFKNMNTDGAGNTLHISLNTSIQQPDTSADGLQGMYGIGGLDFMHAYGTHNTFLGEQAGNRTLIIADAADNTGIGFQTLTTLTHGDKNCALGESVLSALTEGEENTGFGWHCLSQLVGATGVSGLRNLALGSNAGANLLQGNDNVLIGFHAGDNYIAAESNNILIGSDVVGVAAESNNIRIGIQGTHNAAYMAGIYHTVPGGTGTGVVLCDNNGQLGTGANPTNGFVLIGGTNGPIWAPITGAGGTTITLGDHTLLVSSVGGGGGGLLTAHTDGGAGHDATVNVVTSDMTFAGDTFITTNGAAHTLTITAAGGTNGQIAISRTGNSPIWGNLASAGGSVVITYPVPGTINLESIGGGGGAGVFHTNTTDANVVGGAISILGADNINTTGATSVVTVHLNQSIVQPVTNNIAAGLPGSQGIYALGANRFMHGYGVFNTFIGQTAGNLTLLVAAQDNTGLGNGALNHLTSGSQNTAGGSQSGFAISSGLQNSLYGYESGQAINSGSNNVGIGYQSLNGITTGSNNIALGTGSGFNLVATNHDNIDIGNGGVGGDINIMRLGTDGVGAGQQNACYIAGIYNRAIGATNGVVMMDNAFKLGSSNGANGQVLIGGGTGPTWASLTAGAGILITPGANTITITNTGGGGGAVVGGTNININPAGTVNLNSSIQQPITNVAGTSGIYALGSTALPGGYIANRFMHNYSNVATSYDTYLGLTAGNINVAHTGSYNTGIGYGVLNALTSGEFNICIGHNTGGALTTGSDNMGCGGQVLYACTTGTGNTAGGHRSLYELVTGSHNTCYGFESGYNTTVSNNTFIGYQAGLLATTSDLNVALGYEALDALTTVAGGLSGNNTALGQSTLGALVTGSFNTALGANSGLGYTANESNNIIIGNLGVATENNTIRIGTQGAGAAQQNRAFMAGIANVTVSNPLSVMLYIPRFGFSIRPAILRWDFAQATRFRNTSCIPLGRRALRSSFVSLNWSARASVVSLMACSFPSAQ